MLFRPTSKRCWLVFRPKGSPYIDRKQKILMICILSIYYEGIISNEQFDDVQKERERRNNIEFDEESIEDLYFLYDVQSRPAFVDREGGMYR